MMNDDSVVGCIGLGLMGHGIAFNILKSGRPVIFFEHEGNQPVDDLIENGGRPYRAIQELVADSDIIILCVTGTPEVEALIFAEDGILNSIKQGTVVIDCSTSIPDSTLKIEQALQSVGAKFIDAPMTRTPKEAAEGKLNLIVGADEELFQSHLPLLQNFAENIVHAGPVGSGHTMKLLHNFVSLGFSAVLAEAAACANKSAISNDVFIGVLQEGGGAGVILDRLTPYIKNHDDSGFRFTLSNAAKDMGYYQQLSEKVGASSLLAEVIHNAYANAEKDSKAGSSVPSLIDLLSK